MRQSSTAKGWIAKRTPTRVETPFPPLKLWNSGKICPNIADSPNTI